MLKGHARVWSAAVRLHDVRLRPLQRQSNSLHLLWRVRAPVTHIQHTEPATESAAGWGPPGPDWDAGGRRYPPFDDGGRYRHPYDARGSFDRPASPPIPRRGPSGGGSGGWNRAVSPTGFPVAYDRPAAGGRSWGAGAGWDVPPDRRKEPSPDRDVGWGVSAASRGPPASAVPLEALSPERDEPRLPSPPKQAPPAPLTALPAPPLRRAQRESSPTATPSSETPHTHGRLNGLREAEPTLKDVRPNGVQHFTELSYSSRADGAEAGKPQQSSDRRVVDSDQGKAPSSAATLEPPTARVWYYVDPQVCSAECWSCLCRDVISIYITDMPLLILLYIARMRRCIVCDAGCHAGAMQRGSVPEVAARHGEQASPEGRVRAVQSSGGVEGVDANALPFSERLCCCTEGFLTCVLLHCAGWHEHEDAVDAAACHCVMDCVSQSGFDENTSMPGKPFELPSISPRRLGIKPHLRGGWARRAVRRHQVIRSKSGLE